MDSVDKILEAVEGHGKYHTSAYDGPVMTVEDAKAALLSLLEGEAMVGWWDDKNREFSTAIPLSVVGELLS